jgi:uncharacterized SAM-binding protein YcdF (DUF218 family)
MILAPLLDLINLIPRDLLLPPGNLFVLILVGLLVWRRWPRAGKVLAGTGLVLLAFLSTNGGAQLFVAPLEAMTRPLAAPERAGAQAIVVLAAGQLENAPEYGKHSIPDYIALARLRYAAHLHRRTKLPLLVSGGNGDAVVDPDPALREYAKADAMATALREDFGIPVKWIEPASRDTFENARFSAALLRVDGVKRILLVTDAMHMPRSRLVFEQAGLEVVEAPTLFFSAQPLAWNAWIPTAEGMRRSWYAVYELLGLVWYRARMPVKEVPSGS